MRVAASTGFAVAVIAVTAVIYRHAVLSYFTEDDFGWLTDEAAFRFERLLDLARYRHFYRPVIEVPAAGFALLLAEGVREPHGRCDQFLGSRMAAGLAAGSSPPSLSAHCLFRDGNAVGHLHHERATRVSLQCVEPRQE
jgi:hypothetical protein